MGAVGGERGIGGVWVLAERSYNRREYRNSTIQAVLINSRRHIYLVQNLKIV